MCDLCAHRRVAGTQPIVPSRLVFPQQLPRLSKSSLFSSLRAAAVEHEQENSPSESPLSVLPVPSLQTLINLPLKSLPGQSLLGCSPPGPSLPHQPAATHRHTPCPRAPPCHDLPRSHLRLQPDFSEGPQSCCALSPVQLITRAINQRDKEL